ncbi:MAG: hypothetical protein K6G18_01755 [Treponema sp.]|nr:hypothetical protein [Treponema sp.]
MKKIFFAVLAMVIILMLAGCGDEDKKSNKDLGFKTVSSKEIKKFVSKEFGSYGDVQGIYVCDVKDILKTDCYLGKSKKKFTVDGEEVSVPGMHVNVPQKSKKMYVVLTKAYYWNDSNKVWVVFDDDIKGVGNLVISGRNDGYWDCIDINNPDDSDVYNTVILGYGENIGMFGQTGTIKERNVVVDKENKIVFTKMEEEDLEKLTGND